MTAATAFRPALVAPVDTPNSFGEMPAFAVLDLAPDTARLLLSRMEQLRALKAADPSARSIEFEDHTPAWYALAEAPDDGVFAEVLTEAQDCFAPIAIDLSAVPTMPEFDMHSVTLRVTDTLCTWRGMTRDDLAMPLESLYRDDLVRALLVGCPDAERAELAARFLTTDPEVVLELMEGMLTIAGRPDAVPVPALPRETMMPLLEHANADVRQRAILVLGQIPEAPASGARRSGR